MGPGHRPGGHGARRAGPTPRGGRQPLLSAALSAAALALAVWPAPARGLGALIPQDDDGDTGVLASRVLVARTGPGSADYRVQVEYELTTAPPELLWVLPVPPGATDVAASAGGCEVFATLDELAAPRVLVHHRQPVSGCGCDDYAPVEPVPSPIGGHEWHVDPHDGTPSEPRPFETVQALSEWLAAEHGYALPTQSREVFDHYVSQGWSFIVTTVDSPGRTGTLCTSVSYTWEGRYRYLLPTRSAHVGARGEGEDTTVELTVYVLDETRVQPTDGGSPYPATEIDRDAIRLVGDDRTNYDELFRAAVAPAADGPRYFVVEHAGEVPNGVLGVGASSSTWLTRMRTVLQPARILADLPLDQDLGAGAIDNSHSIVVASRAAPAPATALLSALALAACLPLVRRRVRGR